MSLLLLLLLLLVLPGRSAAVLAWRQAQLCQVLLGHQVPAPRWKAKVGRLTCCGATVQYCSKRSRRSGVRPGVLSRIPPCMRACAHRSMRHSRYLRDSAWQLAAVALCCFRHARYSWATWCAVAGGRAGC